MILSITFSKPAGDIESKLGRQYKKIKISVENKGGETAYFAQMFTEKQVFHQHMSEGELQDFIQEHAGGTFKNVVERTDTEEITILANKKGKITRLVKKLDSPTPDQDTAEKNYIIKEGVPVPFLVVLGVMTAEGKVVASRYSKFRQINRFLEFVDDVLPYIVNEGQPVRVADFGCGKSYLTFAVHYFLTEIKHVPCQIEGLDLKQDVIEYCNDITERLGLQGLHFSVGDISAYKGDAAPDLVMTLHACDTATDFALEYAVSRGAKAILSVPCCQHQINTQLQANRKGKIEQDDNALEPILKYGLLREKFSSILTDALRGEWLEQQGYRVQMLEFIDEEHTPKNILIRAVKKSGVPEQSVFPEKKVVPEPVEGQTKSHPRKPKIITELNIKPELWK
ncbi:MAG: SAM-dependent methyltransferase [Treponema sp.]|nr:SAM-dependent methyltransferase [Treponema sp.]